MDHYKKILETLSKQLQLNQELLIFSQEKLELLRQNETAALMVISDAEEKIIRQIIQLEKERGQVINLLRSQGQDITNIHQLIEKSSPQMSVELKEISENLSKVLNELQLQNDINKKIMDFNLEQIEISKNFILSDERPFNYGRATGNYGREKKTADNKFFEGRA